MRNAVTQSGLTNIRILDLQSSLNGRRLCENTVGLLEEKGVAVVDEQQARSTRPSGSTSSARRARSAAPYQIQESVHANYWGQLAMRNCMRLAYNGGVPRGGNCVRTANGLNSFGEPRMALQ